jgi:putative salt-induced outer membrane protein YdiY
MLRLCAPAVVCLLTATGARQIIAQDASAEVLRLPPLTAPVEEVVLPAEQPPAEPMPPLDAWITPYWPGWIEWDGSFEVGLNGTEGNTQTFNLHSAAKLKRKTEFVEQTLEGRWIDKSAAGVNTARNGFLEGRSEWPWQNSPWSMFVHGLIEYDEFRAFDARVAADAGLGYKLLENDLTTIKARFGASGSHEIGGADDDIRPELLGALEFERKLSDRQKLSGSVEYYPDVTDFADYRMNTRVSWEVVVDPVWGLSLKFSAFNRHDSTPGGLKPNDIDYSAVMLWSF